MSDIERFSFKDLQLTEGLNGRDVVNRVAEAFRNFGFIVVSQLEEDDLFLVDKFRDELKMLFGGVSRRVAAGKNIQLRRQPRKIAPQEKIEAGPAEKLCEELETETELGLRFITELGSEQTVGLRGCEEGKMFLEIRFRPLSASPLYLGSVAKRIGILSRALVLFYDQIGRRVLEILQESGMIPASVLGDTLVDFMSEAKDTGEKASDSCLRGCFYPTNKGSEGFGAHTDTTFLTVSSKGSTSGLRIRVKGEWVEVESLLKNDQLLIFAGEYLKYVSGFTIPAVIHEVRSSSERVSFPYLLRATRGIASNIHENLPFALVKSFIKRKRYKQSLSSQSTEWILH